MSSKSYSGCFEPRVKVLLGAILLGLLLGGCNERPKELVASEDVNLCPNPGAPISLFAARYDPATRQGWYVNGPGFAGQKKELPMGRFDNQIVVELAVPAEASMARIKLQVSGTVPTAAVILDTIWYSGLKELGRSAPSIELGKAPGNVISTTQAVVPGADRLMLVARPWREVDGILMVGEGEFVWCKK